MASQEAEVKPEEKADEVKEDVKDDVKEEAEAKEVKEEAETKTEMETEEVVEEEVKEEVKVQPKLQEETDAAEDKRAKVKPESVCWSMDDATCNVMPSVDGRLLMTLCNGGFQYLFAGVRCSAGVKAGRYMFEAKIAEMMNPSEGPHPNNSMPRPRQVVRLGFSVAGKSSVLDESTDSVYFDSEGNFHDGSARSKRRPAARRFGKDQVMAVLLNLDASSPNANTISLFCDGSRFSDPQPLPEALVGKVLYPTVFYKNVAVDVNFGPAPKKALPFTCRMLKDAAAADVEVAAPAKSKKNEVLFPVGLPDQGLFDWLDAYLEQNPQFVELSDRKVLEWAKQSNVHRQRGYEAKNSNDKPGMNFNTPLLDDGSVQKTLAAVAPALKRDFVHMELKSNLVKAEREAALKAFPSTDFKKVAVVVMGEPPADVKTKAQERFLAEKVKQAQKDKQKAQGEKDGQKKSKKQRKAERNKARKEEAEKEKAGQEATKDEAEKVEKVEGEGEASAAKDGEEGDGAKKDAEEKEEADMEVDEEEAKEEEEKPIELTDEEKKTIWYPKSNTQDLSRQVLAKAFASFALPQKEEGFDEIRYVWQKEAQCAEHLKGWMLENKKTTRAEDLEPSDWFKEKLAAWTKVREEWRKLQSSASEKIAKNKRAKKEKDTKEEKKEDKGEEKKDGEEETKEGEEGGEKKEEAEEAKPAEEKAEEAADEEFNDEPDVDTVEDVNDIGNGSPLYLDFAYEDWVLLGLRFEFHLLAHAFKRDLNDADRPGFPEAHLAFYYNKYYKKSFDVKWFNVTDLAGLVELVKDTLSINTDTGFLESKLSAEEAMDKFMRLTEEGRRERQRCIDAGDETANLKFQRPGPQGQGPRGDKGDHRGGRDNRDRGTHRGERGDRGDRGGDRGSVGAGGRGPPSRTEYGKGSDRRGFDKGRGGFEKGHDKGRGFDAGAKGYGKRDMMPPARGGPLGPPGYGPAGPSRYGGGAPPAYSPYPPPAYGGGDRGGYGAPRGAYGR